MLSFVDMGLIGVVALLVFGPDQLPKVARRAGQIMRDVQNTSQSFIREMERAADEHELPAIAAQPSAELTPAASDVTPEVTPAEVTPAEPYAGFTGALYEPKADAIVDAYGPLTAAPAYHEAPVAQASVALAQAEPSALEDALPEIEPYVESEPIEPGVHSHPRESPP